MIESEWKSPSSIDIKAKKDKGQRDKKSVARTCSERPRERVGFAHTRADKRNGLEQKWENNTQPCSKYSQDKNAHGNRDRQAARTQNRDGEDKITKDISKDNKGEKVWVER